MSKRNITINRTTLSAMKNILLTAVLSISMFLGILYMLEKNETIIPEHHLPAVEIKAPKITPDSTLDNTLHTGTVTAKN